MFSLSEFEIEHYLQLGQKIYEDNGVEVTAQWSAQVLSRDRCATNG